MFTIAGGQRDTTSPVMSSCTILLDSARSSRKTSNPSGRADGGSSAIQPAEVAERGPDRSGPIVVATERLRAIPPPPLQVGWVDEQSGRIGRAASVEHGHDLGIACLNRPNELLVPGLGAALVTERLKVGRKRRHQPVDPDLRSDASFKSRSMASALVRST